MKDLVHSAYADLKPMFERYSRDEYYKYIFQFEMDVFRERVDMVGFRELGRVLDAGCGYGQWAVALAESNNALTALDRDAGMVEITRTLAQRFATENVVVKQHDLNAPLPYPDASFDGVWCWGVIMFVNRDLALREFRRVLKPGGKLLLGAVNSYGRWLLKLLTALNPLRPDPAVARMAWKALRYGRRPNAFPSLTSSWGAASLLARYGFTVEQTAIDGRIDVSGCGRSVPIFPPRFMLIEGNIEVLARKIAP